MKNLFLACLLIAEAWAHSWLDCVDYDCPVAGPDAGPQPPQACTCKGYPRNWASVMAGAPFAADRGRDNRPGLSPANGGLFCDTGKEPNPGPGTGIPAGLYSATYPMASLAKGQNVRWRWPAKNHANTPAAGTVEVYISSTPNGGDVFTPASPIRGQMSYSSDGGDCLGLATSTDTADCQGTWQVPTDLQEGRYTIMWWWEFNPGEFYNTCADVFITAAEGTPPGGGVTPPVGGPPSPGAGGGPDGVVAPPRTPAEERSVVKVIMTVAGNVVDFTPAKRAQVASDFAVATNIATSSILVSASAGYGTSAAGDSSVDVTVDIQTASEAAAINVQNVLSTQLSNVATATALLSTAQVAVLRVQAVERVLPSEIGGSGNSLAGERDGWRASTLAVLALLFAGTGAAIYFYYLRKEQGSSSAGKAAPSPTFEMNPATVQHTPKPPPPGRPPPPAALPPGWSASVDPASGHTYYVSTKGESTWSHPGQTLPV